MTIARTRNLAAHALVGVLFAATAQAQTVETPIGKLEFDQGVPTKATVENLYDQMDFQRAGVAHRRLWRLPLLPGDRRAPTGC